MAMSPLDPTEEEKQRRLAGYSPLTAKPPAPVAPSAVQQKLNAIDPQPLDMDKVVGMQSPMPDDPSIPKQSLLMPTQQNPVAQAASAIGNNLDAIGQNLSGAYNQADRAVGNFFTGYPRSAAPTQPALSPQANTPMTQPAIQDNLYGQQATPKQGGIGGMFAPKSQMTAPAPPLAAPLERQATPISQSPIHAYQPYNGSGGSTNLEYNRLQTEKHNEYVKDQIGRIMNRYGDDPRSAAALIGAITNFKIDIKGESGGDAQPAGAKAVMNPAIKAMIDNASAQSPRLGIILASSAAAGMDEKALSAMAMMDEERALQSYQEALGDAGATPPPRGSTPQTSNVPPPLSAAPTAPPLTAVPPQRKKRPAPLQTPDEYLSSRYYPYRNIG